jgi:hypothetical protein
MNAQDSAHEAEYAAIVRGLYEELLFAVGKKYPSETRHQTALRYIRRAEAPRTPLSDAQVLKLRSQHGWAKETIRAIEAALLSAAAETAADTETKGEH